MSMPLDQHHLIGKEAVKLVIDTRRALSQEFKESGFRACTGKVGSMDSQKIVAAIETAAKSEGLINKQLYRESHALYHAIVEAMHGVTRGHIQLGAVLRTVGLRFSILRGNPYENEEEGEWIAVALYGTIGAPVKGLEHEAIGLGINHI